MVVAEWVEEWEVTEWEVMEWHRILPAVVDLAALVQTGISHFFITISITAAGFSMIAMADFSVIAMISSSGTVSSLVLTSRHLDSLAGGTLMTTPIRIPIPTMTTRLPLVTNHRHTAATLHRMEPNIGVT
jgi:hypothetical protein